MNLLVCLIFATAAFALPNVALPTGNGSTDSSNIGETVLSIQSANLINDWEQIDKQRVVLSLGPDESYLLTLKSQCQGLSWARNIGVTMSNNTIWAEFDAVTTDGMQCPIQRINRVTREQVDGLRI